MLKIVYPVCCGMDVHKNFLVACIASTDNCGVTSYKTKRFSTYSSDLRLCRDWLVDNNCKDVCMESTGKYWIPIYNVLESSCNIVLAHPKYVKAIRGKKTDKKDAKWIADIFMTWLTEPCFDGAGYSNLFRYCYHFRNRCGYVRVPLLKAFMLLGRAYTSKQRKCRQEKDYQNFSCRYIYQAVTCSMCFMCCKS